MDHHEEKFICVNKHCKHNNKFKFEANSCHLCYVDRHFVATDDRGNMKCMNFEPKKKKKRG